jgi:IS5 family transposase
LHGLSDFELDKQRIAQISFRKFIGFPEYILDSTPVCSFRKRTINNYKENKYVDICKANLIALVLKIKKGMIHDIILSIQTLDMQNLINLEKMKQKKNIQRRKFDKKVS